MRNETKDWLSKFGIYGNVGALFFCISPLFFSAAIAMKGAPTYQQVILTVVSWIVCFLLYSVVVFQDSRIPRLTRYWLLFAAQVTPIGGYILWSSKTGA